MDIAVVQPNETVYRVIEGQIKQTLKNGNCLDSHFEGKVRYMNDRNQEIVPDALFLEHHDSGIIKVEIKNANHIA